MVDTHIADDHKHRSKNEIHKQPQAVLTSSGYCFWVEAPVFIIPKIDDGLRFVISVPMLVQFVCAFFLRLVLEFLCLRNLPAGRHARSLAKWYVGLTGRLRAVLAHKRGGDLTVIW